jgi:hypothetical protein
MKCHEDFSRYAASAGGARISAGAVLARWPGTQPRLQELNDSCVGCDKWWLDRIYFEVKNFHDYVPAGTSIEVFLRAAGSTDWVEVPNSGDENYVYRINSQTPLWM